MTQITTYYISVTLLQLEGQYHSAVTPLLSNSYATNFYITINWIFQRKQSKFERSLCQLRVGRISSGIVSTKRKLSSAEWIVTTEAKLGHGKPKTMVLWYSTKSLWYSKHTSSVGIPIKVVWYRASSYKKRFLDAKPRYLGGTSVHWWIVRGGIAWVWCPKLRWNIFHRLCEEFLYHAVGGYLGLL